MKKLLALLFAVLMFVTYAVSADAFAISDYNESEIRDIRRQIHEQLSLNKLGDILYEDENVNINYLGWKKSYSSYEFWVTFVNNTDRKLMVVSDNTSVNDAACDVSYVFEIPAGKRTNNILLDLYESTLKEQWIDHVEYAEFTIKYYDSDDWQGLRIEIPTPFKIEFVEPTP